jgi:monothiol glutaredoxin
MDQQFKEKIDKLIAENNIVLFMKGFKHNPMCGFSARVVSMLSDVGVDYHSENIFDDPQIRTGMKEYSSWPTFPQLYVNQEFVGGCDIITGMFTDGSLHSLLGVSREEVPVPEVEITDAAIDAFKAAMQRYEGVHIILEISPQFQYDMGLGQSSPGDLAVTSNGFTMYMNRASAKLADGMKIDFENGQVKIDNPNEPTSVHRINVREFKQWIELKKEHILFDVRGEDERAVAKIESALPYHADSLEDVSKDSVIVFQCHHGMRSYRAAQEALTNGYKNVYNLEGGIHAWSLHIDPLVPTY